MPKLQIPINSHPAIVLELGVWSFSGVWELINNFGHGTWGRDLVLFHPTGAGFQALRRQNLLDVKPCLDPAFRSFMPGDAVAEWKIIPIGLLPYRKHIFLDVDLEEIIVYDGDYCEAVRTGVIGPSRFIVESLRWREVELPRIWIGFAEANWPVGTPVFSPNCRRDSGSPNKHGHSR